MSNEVLDYKQSGETIMNSRAENRLNRLKVNDKEKDKGKKEERTKKGCSERHYIY